MFYLWEFSVQTNAMLNMMSKLKNTFLRVSEEITKKNKDHRNRHIKYLETYLKRRYVRKIGKRKNALICD